MIADHSHYVFSENFSRKRENVSRMITRLLYKQIKDSAPSKKETTVLKLEIQPEEIAL